MGEAWDFVVGKDDLRTTEVLPARPPEDIDLAPGEVLIAIEHFSLTANNVTYAALGEQLSYWRFYPAPEPWGRIPAWGYAHVVASTDPDLGPGTRIFGYLPMSTHAVLVSGGVRDGGFVDASQHRRRLPAVYNRYRIVTRPAEGDREQRVALFMPLYGTSWLLADWLVAEDFRTADRLVASSASSKTALGLAHALQRDFGSPVTTVGLTSARHREFTQGTGHWDSVLTYDDLSSLDSATPTVFVDFSGNDQLLRQVRAQLGSALVPSVSVGMADWESRGSRADGRIADADLHFFFAPEWTEQRSTDWGPAGLAHRLSRSQDRFIERSHEWLTVQTGSGPDAIRQALLGLLDGAVAPDIGIDLTPSN